MIELDLRKNGILSIADAKKISYLEPIVRESYNQYIGKLAKKNNLYEEQWLLRVTCRNTYLSLVHDHFCRLALLESKLNHGDYPDVVLLDGFSMELPVRQLLRRFDCDATIKIDRFRIISILLVKSYFLLNLIKNIYLCLNNWLWIKLFSIKKLPYKPIVLLDTFSVDDQSHYYGGLLENVPVTMRDNIYFLPTLFGLRYPWEWLSKFRHVAKSNDNILLKECWLKWSDYLSAIYRSLSLTNAIKTIPKWNNLNVSSIVRDEILLDKGSFSITNSLLIILSFNRYRDAGIKINGVVDWFENQVIDRALTIGVKRYYPEVKIKGYMGSVAGEYYAGLTPMLYERTNKIIPDEILLVGPYFVKKKRSSCPWLKILTAPAFRFQKIIEFKQNKRISKRIILLAMPMLLNEAERMVKLALSTQLDSLYIWKIKVHPTISEKKFKDLIPASCNEKFIFTNQPLNTIFQETKLLVTIESSSAFDAVACGIPVAIVGSRSGPTINPLLNIVNNQYWSVCYSSNELEAAILRDFPEKKLNISEYLQPTTKEGVIRMMNFEL